MSTYEPAAYTDDRGRWYPTTPAEYGRMLREEAERRREQLVLSFRYGEVPSVESLAETVAGEYETRTGPTGMEYRRRPLEARL